MTIRRCRVQNIYENRKVKSSSANGTLVFRYSALSPNNFSHIWSRDAHYLLTACDLIPLKFDYLSPSCQPVSYQYCLSVVIAYSILFNPYTVASSQLCLGWLVYSILVVSPHQVAITVQVQSRQPIRFCSLVVVHMLRFLIHMCEPICIHSSTSDRTLKLTKCICTRSVSCVLTILCTPFPSPWIS